MLLQEVPVAKNAVFEMYLNRDTLSCEEVGLLPEQ